jgi:hypothetical protein
MKESPGELVIAAETLVDGELPATFPFYGFRGALHYR